MRTGAASSGPARSPTISRSPKCWNRSGQAVSHPPATNGKPGWLPGRCRTLPGRARAAASSPGRAGRDKRDNEELVRVWYCEKNFGRRDRAIELAARLGKNPIHVALAYVLAQPLPSIPLIGPRTPGELVDSHQAFDIRLSPGDLEWRDGGSYRST